MKIEKINKLIAKGRVQAIVKEVAGRRMLFGLERLNKRSRKSHVKYLSQPIDLAALTKGAQRAVEKAAAAPTTTPEPSP
jgi:hypothetical protein